MSPVLNRQRGVIRSLHPYIRDTDLDKRTMDVSVHEWNHRIRLECRQLYCEQEDGSPHDERCCQRQAGLDYCPVSLTTLFLPGPAD